jgi:hypothetical protein
MVGNKILYLDTFRAVWKPNPPLGGKLSARRAHAPTRAHPHASPLPVDWTPVRDMHALGSRTLGSQARIRF